MPSIAVENFLLQVIREGREEHRIMFIVFFFRSGWSCLGRPADRQRIQRRNRCSGHRYTSRTNRFDRRRWSSKTNEIESNRIESLRSIFFRKFIIRSKRNSVRCTLARSKEWTIWFFSVIWKNRQFFTIFICVTKKIKFMFVFCRVEKMKEKIRKENSF